MTRLSKQSRESIVCVLLNHRFAEQGEALAERSAQLFKLVYEDTYDAESRRLMAKLKQRHKNAFQHDSQISCNARGFRIAIGD